MHRWNSKAKPQIKGNRRSSTGILDFKKHCIICGEYCNVIKDKKLPDR